jgi:hypothetical protein
MFGNVSRVSILDMHEFQVFFGTYVLCEMKSGMTQK